MPSLLAPIYGVKFVGKSIHLNLVAGHPQGRPQGLPLPHTQFLLRLQAPRR